MGCNIQHILWKMTLNLYATTQGVRVTPDGRVSVLDVIRVIKGCSSSRAGLLYTRLAQKAQVPECELFTFKRPTPVTDARGITQLIWALPSKHGFRRECVDLYARYIGTLDPQLCTETSRKVSTSLET